MNLWLYLRTQWDRALAVAAVGLGIVFLLLGYAGIRDAVLVERQMPYIISGGIGGLFLLAIGAVLWLSADLRDDWRELKELRLQVERLGDVQDADESDGLPGSRLATAGRGASPGLRKPKKTT